MADDQTQAPLVANFNGTPRIQWTAPLHERFVSVVAELGGPNEAKPKAILERMGVEGLNVRHIKSHLQKYRIIIRRMDESMNSEQIAEVVNNVPLAQTIPAAHAMGDYRVYNVPGVQTREGISNAPYDIRGNQFYDMPQVVTKIQGTSIAPAPYDVRGLGVYREPELPAGAEEIPHVLPNFYDTRSQDDYASLRVPIGTEINPYLAPAPQTVGSYETYDVPGFQTGMEGIMEEERCNNRYTDIRYINDTTNQLEAFNSTMDYSNSTPSLPTWETTHTMGDQEIYNQPMQQGMEGVVQEKYRYYGGSLDSSNNKGKGIMELPPHDAFNSTMDYSFSTPSLPTWETTYTMGETTYAMGDQQFYNQQTTRQGIERVVQEDNQYYGGSLDSGNNNKGKGIMGLPPHDVVANHLDFPTNIMPSSDTMPTPYGMGSYELYDGLNIQREIEAGGVQEASEVEKHIMIQEDVYENYMDSTIEDASKLIPSSETQSTHQGHK